MRRTGAVATRENDRERQLAARPDDMPNAKGPPEAALLHHLTFPMYLGPVWGPLVEKPALFGFIVCGAVEGRLSK
ncbi:hypothetical protein [Bradyrhizobium sp. USDA 3315]